MYIVRGTITKRMDRDVEVKLSNGQTIKAVRLNKLDLNEDEQYPRIKTGTEALVLIDRDGNAFTLGSIAQTTKQESKKQYLVKNGIVRLQAGEIALESESGGNADKITVKSNDTKIESKKTVQEGDNFESKYKSTKISNNSDELFALLTKLVNEISSIKIMIPSGSSAGMWKLDPSSIAKLKIIGAKLDAFN